jgi:hypothetical protein
VHVLALGAPHLLVQAGGLGAVTKAVEELGGFDQQYEQIEKVSAHHGNFWEVLLYGQIGRDRAVMFDLAERLEFTETSEDRRVLDALAHAMRHRGARGEYITAFDEEGKEVDISFATQNWRKAVVDKTRAGQFVRKHFEAMVFTALAEELRTGDVAVVGSEEYADWSKQLLDWEVVKEKLGTYLVEVGLCEEGETDGFDAVCFRRQLEDKLTAAATAVDARYPDNEGLIIDPETGIPSLKPHRSEGQQPSARRLEQEIKARMPERSLMGIVARTAYWVDWWQRFDPASGNEPKLDDPFGRYVITTFVKGTNTGPYEAARYIPGVSGHELAYVANRHFSIVLLNEAIADLANAHARLDISQAWGDGTTVAADGTCRRCRPGTLRWPVCRRSRNTLRPFTRRAFADLTAGGGTANCEAIRVARRNSDLRGHDPHPLLERPRLRSARADVGRGMQRTGSRPSPGRHATGARARPGAGQAPRSVPPPRLTPQRAVAPSAGHGRGGSDGSGPGEAGAVCLASAAALLPPAARNPDCAARPAPGRAPGGRCPSG